MTGAGSAEVAFAVEDTYGSLPTDPTWYQPGIDVEVSTASLENALRRARHPDDPTPSGSVEGPFEGALSVSFTMTDTNFHDLVFADGGTALPSSIMLAPTATWYLSADTLSSTQERFLSGAAVESCVWNYNRTAETVTVELIIIYGDEPDGLSAPTSITQPSVSDAVPYHGTDFQLDGATVEDMQSLSLELSGLARFRRGQSRHPTDAVTGAIQPALSLQAILKDGTRTELGYGSAGATSPQDTIDKTPGTLTFDNSSGTVAQYNLSGLQPTTQDWADLTSSDTDITDPTDFHVAGVAVA